MSIDDLFSIAVEEKASDLHIVVGLPPILRVDGELKPIDGKNKIEAKEAEDLIFSILTPSEFALGKR